MAALLMLFPQESAMTDIVHDPALGRFFLRQDGYQAELDYRREGG